jgi:flagellar assembly protein FliH
MAPLPTRLPRFLEAVAPKKDRPAFPAPAHAPAPRPVAVAVARTPEPPPPDPPRAAPVEPVLKVVELPRAVEHPPGPAEAPEPPPGELDQASAERISAAVAELRLESERLAEQARSDALEVGFQVARRILEMELTASPQPLFALIRSALRRAGEARAVSVYLSPRDAARVREAGGERALGELAAAKVEVLEDPELVAGDCVVQTELGAVDGRLTSRLDELRRAALQAMAEREP